MPFFHPGSTELRVANASYSVKTNQGEKKILHDISFVAKNGEMLALMGPSGAGKTTLLELMTLELKGGKPTGSVRINGERLSFELFRQQAAYVEQYDTHWGYLTCREIMHFAAQLYMSGGRKHQEERAERMMAQLGLSECADAKAGNAFIKGLSGGQRKRLTLGVALLKGPVVLFLDEPTSGLDAASCASVTGYLRQLAKESNMIIVATIHQPSTDVFMSFDRVLVLANGRTAFSGLTADLAGYCSFVGHPLPPMTNPADHFLMIVNSEFVGREQVDSIVRRAKFELRDPARDLWRPLGQKLKYTTTRRELDEELTRTSTGSITQVTSVAEQTCILLRRHLLLSFRDPSLYLGRMAAFLASNSFFAWIYHVVREPKQDTAEPRVRLLIWFVAVPSIFSVVTVYATNNEFSILRMEMKNGLTRATAFLVANFILQIPYMFCLAAFALVIPWLIGNFTWNGFHLVMCAMAAMLWAFEGIGQFIGVCFKNAIVGMLAMVTLWFCCFLFMGVFLEAGFIDWPFRALVYSLPLSWTVEAITYLGLQDITFAGAEPTAGGGFKCTSTDLFAQCFGYTGNQVLNTLHVRVSSVVGENHVAKDIGFILAIGVVAKFLYIAAALQKSRWNRPVQSVHKEQDEDTDTDSSEEDSTEELVNESKC